MQWNAKSKIGSLENAAHKPGGGDKKIETLKMDFKDKAKSKVNSKDNVKHQPGGGDIKVCAKTESCNHPTSSFSSDPVAYVLVPHTIINTICFLISFPPLPPPPHSQTTTKNS